MMTDHVDAIESSAASISVADTDIVPQETGVVALDPDRLRTLEMEFERTLVPRSAVERRFVKQAATAAACLELAENWELDIARELEKNGINPWQISDAPITEGLGELCQQMLGSSALLQASRYASTHFRRLAQSLQELRKLQQRTVTRRLAINPYDESECIANLRQRFENDDWACPKCGQHAGDWLSSRKAWECRNCHRQVGLRVGTPMESSPLPLAIWGYAYELLAAAPELSTSQLGELLQINRPDTVRRLRKTLLDLLDDPDALGGLVS